jgi:hypothetical protein
LLAEAGLFGDACRMNARARRIIAENLIAALRAIAANCPDGVSVREDGRFFVIEGLGEGGRCPFFIAVSRRGSFDAEIAGELLDEGQKLDRKAEHIIPDVVRAVLAGKVSKVWLIDRPRLRRIRVRLGSFGKPDFVATWPGCCRRRAHRRAGRIRYRPYDENRLEPD